MQSPKLNFSPRGLFIGGRWVAPADDRSFVSINPFNHPFRFCAEKAAAPLAAGNTVVIKGSEQAPLSSLCLAELCAGIFPDGVVNIIAGDGSVGAALVRHPNVRRIGFVGSVPTGRAIAQAAAADLKRTRIPKRRRSPLSRA